jgi:16S rRNA (adenine1518-N6/adenine1519-N6)-dimethyltransferase
MSGPSPARPKRSLGQNFLVDPNLQRKIVSALGAKSTDEVVEIGPGRGALTHHLMGTVGRLVLVELDNELAAWWTAEAAGRDEVQVVHGDVLEQPFWQHVRDPSRALVVGNIPYNITSPIIFRLLKRPRPREIVLMVQREVADRITARVGSKAYGALAVGVRSVAKAERLFGVGRKAFRPIPGVDSAVIRITPLKPEPLVVADEERLRGLVRAVFQWRRKQLGKILRDHPDLLVPSGQLGAIAESVGFDLADRPERLSPDDFIRLAAALPSF